MNDSLSLSVRLSLLPGIFSFWRWLRYDMDSLVMAMDCMDGEGWHHCECAAIWKNGLKVLGLVDLLYFALQVGRGQTYFLRLYSKTAPEISPGLNAR